MPDFFFYLFASAALICAFLVVFKREPLLSAIFLIITLCNVAALYLFFGAGFLAAIQIIVYAGAVMVLFLFIIMLLPAGQVQEEEDKGFRRAVTAASVFLSAELIALVLGAGTANLQTSPTVADEAVTISNIGTLLFGRFLVPFELVSFLLLVAVIGVVMLTQSAEKKGEGRPA